MKKAYDFRFTVEPKNLKKAQKLFDQNKDLFVRVVWNKTEIKII